MKKLILTFSFLVLLFGTLQASVSIIPMPQKCIEKRGNFTVNDKTVITLSVDNEEMRNAVSFWNDLFDTAAGFSLEVSSTPRSSNVIRCRLNTALPNEESYKLTVSSSSIHIDAKTPKGIFYAFQTLRQLLPSAIESDKQVAEKIKWNIPCVVIEDSPAFSYRGVMLDVSRHFIPKEDVKRHIDLLAFHKLNILHWHLTDDQGWRIEIKKYPKLTTVGGYRKKTIVGYMWDNPTEWNTKRYGGFYTQEDIKEVVAYAKKRFVEIIPEIEMPGHSVAALTAYPEYSCTGGPFEVEGRWGVFNDIYCTKESTFTFMQDILDEVVELFPSSYIHLGGDEAPRIRWKNCVHCQERMKQEHLTKEAELQTYFINRIENYLNTKGKKIIGWDEILEGGILQRATVMSWRGEKGGIEAAKQKHDVIMTPNTYLYFDYYQAKDIENEPFGIGGYLPMERVYSYEPMPASLTPEEQKYIKGVQANLWTEYIATFPHAQYMVLPRWAALCEIQWSSPEKKNYANFLSRLPQLIKWYDAEGYNYAKHVFDVQAEFDPNPAEGTMDVTLSTIDGAPVYYTLDGTEPTAASPVYEGVLKIKENVTLSAKAIRPNGESKTVTEKIDFSKSSMKPIVANQPINEQYLFKGASTLIDGLKGNSSYKSGRWIAFNGNDMDMTIDFQQPTEISSVAISTNVAKGDWVFDARNLSVETSDDGKTFKKIASEEYPEMKETDKDGIVEHKLTFAPVTTQYVRVIASPEKSLPAWHGGKGKNAFLFVDEIKID